MHQFTVIGLQGSGEQHVRAALDTREEVNRAISDFEHRKLYHTVLVVDTTGPDPKMEEHILTQAEPQA